MNKIKEMNNIEKKIEEVDAFLSILHEHKNKVTIKSVYHQGWNRERIEAEVELPKFYFDKMDALMKDYRDELSHGLDEIYKDELAKVSQRIKERKKRE